jgi:type I restriction enzyme M protein
MPAISEVEELVSKLKVFKEDEFADLLHNAIRDSQSREKDPAAAFDEIAKVLFC